MSVLMIVAGVLVIIIGILSMISKINSGDAERIFILAAALLAVIGGVTEIVSGTQGLGRKKQAVMLGKGARLAAASVLICLAQIIISVVNGVTEWQLAGLLITGILIPVIYLASVRSVRIGKLMRGGVNAARR